MKTVRTVLALVVVALVISFIGYCFRVNFVNHEVRHIHCELGSYYGHYVVTSSNDTNYVGISQLGDYHVKGNWSFTCSK